MKITFSKLCKSLKILLLDTQNYLTGPSVVGKADVILSLSRYRDGSEKQAPAPHVPDTFQRAFLADLGMASFWSTICSKVGSLSIQTVEHSFSM